MRVVVPFGAANPKTRLDPVLDADERRAFAEAMLADVLAALDGVREGNDDGFDPDGHDGPRRDGADGADCDVEPTVVADGPVACAAPVVVDERSLTAAVDARLPDSWADGPVAVVMADLPLATPTALRRLFAPDADVVLAPGRGGGTNAMVVRHPDFSVDYHGASIRDHRERARDVGAAVTTVDSYRLGTDVDEPEDLAEVLLHADGAAAEWLVAAGFEVATADGRVTVARN